MYSLSRRPQHVTKLVTTTKTQQPHNIVLTYQCTAFVWTA